MSMWINVVIIFDGKLQIIFRKEKLENYDNTEKDPNHQTNKLLARKIAINFIEVSGIRVKILELCLLTCLIFKRLISGLRKLILQHFDEWGLSRRKILISWTIGGYYPCPKGLELGISLRIKGWPFRTKMWKNSLNGLQIFRIF